MARTGLNVKAKIGLFSCQPPAFGVVTDPAGPEGVPLRSGCHPLSRGIRRASSPRGRAKTAKKASQSSLRQQRKRFKIVFDRGVYVGENTSQAASVEFVRLWRTNYARSRLQKMAEKPEGVFRQAELSQRERQDLPPGFGRTKRSLKLDPPCGIPRGGFLTAFFLLLW